MLNCKSNGWVVVVTSVLFSSLAAAEAKQDTYCFDTTTNIRDMSLPPLPPSTAPIESQNYSKSRDIALRTLKALNKAKVYTSCEIKDQYEKMPPYSDTQVINPMLVYLDLLLADAEVSSIETRRRIIDLQNERRFIARQIEIIRRELEFPTPVKNPDALREENEGRLKKRQQTLYDYIQQSAEKYAKLTALNVVIEDSNTFLIAHKYERRYSLSARCLIASKAEENLVKYDPEYHIGRGYYHRSRKTDRTDEACEYLHFLYPER